jgi:hypothetical protein
MLVTMLSQAASGAAAFAAAVASHKIESARERGLLAAAGTAQRIHVQPSQLQRWVFLGGDVDA